MELNIDGKPCDLGSERIAVPGYAAAALADVEAAREGRSLTLTIPATMRNDALAGFARDPHTAERFNATLHTAELTAEGSVMLSGTVRMLSASDEGYRIEIRDGRSGLGEKRRTADVQRPRRRFPGGPDSGDDPRRLGRTIRP